MKLLLLNQISIIEDELKLLKSAVKSNDPIKASQHKNVAATLIDDLDDGLIGLHASIVENNKAIEYSPKN